ncbi:MAG: radical SAM family heme chaperone HemW [Coriobacteriales bacterium]|nr:radical SAM family heme chaperone HemW [Coriobacteriales bacterium]
MNTVHLARDLKAGGSGLARISGLYIHIPFCACRCYYCDFFAQAPGSEAAMDTHLAAVIQAIRRSAACGLLADITTIYIGGGTPSYFGHGRLVQLAYTLGLSLDLTRVVEFTCEANPESLTPRLVADLYALGVNRLALGAQSFHDSELRALGRIHDAAQIQRALQAARLRFDNISLDLICGIPTQSLSSWQQSLEAAVAAEVSHVSVYPLQIEPHTVLEAQARSGHLVLADEDEVATMLLVAADRLQAAGLHRYETASYATRDRECQHNICYWTGQAYLGVGAGAASMFNLSDGSRLRLHPANDNPSNINTEALNRKQALAEDLMLGMRMMRGLSLKQINDAATLLPGLDAAIQELEALALVERKDDRLVPSTCGWLLGNEIFLRLMPDVLMRAPANNSTCHSIR